MDDLSCLVLVGPTAVGKSDLLYTSFGQAPLHVISADSMQVYRGFDVATATPSEAELDLLPHTGINERDPSDSYSVDEFLDLADEAVETAHSRGRMPIVVGGTALYVRAFLYGLNEMPDRNPMFRETLREQADSNPDGYLHEQLKEVDPVAAENIHPNDVKRIIRALEIHHETGRTKTELTEGEQTLRDHLDPTIIGLKRPREELKRRIRDRIDRMLANGLIEEVQLLLEQWSVSKTLRQAIGFESVEQYLDGSLAKDDIKDRMYRRTKELVRKQLSWFRKFPVEAWFHPEDEELIETVGNKLDRYERI